MTKDMTSGSPTRLILRFTIPLIFGNLFQQFYSMVDTIIVGRFLGTGPLAAVGSTGSINFLILGFCTGICAGFTIPVSQSYGAKDFQDLKRFVGNILWLASGFTLVITVLTVALCRPILQWMDTPADILDDAYSYIVVIFLGIPTIVLYNVLASLLRALGDSKTPLYFLILTSVLNVGLDLLFVVPFQMGVFGAALATDLSQALSGVISFLYLCRNFEVLSIKGEEARLDRKACLRLTGIGLPMGLQCSITAIGSVIMQWAVNVLGSTAVAAVTAASKTANLLTVPLESVGTAMATYAGQNLGAARMDRVRKGVRSALLIACVYALVSLVLLHFGNVTVMGLFLDTGSEREIVRMGQEYLFWNSVFFIPLGALIVWRYTIQGLGYSTLAMLAGVAEMTARTLVAILLVPLLGYFGAELANPAAWIAACLFLYPAYKWTCRQLDNRLLAARLHCRNQEEIRASQEISG